MKKESYQKRKRVVCRYSCMKKEMMNKKKVTKKSKRVVCRYSCMYKEMMNKKKVTKKVNVLYVDILVCKKK